MNHDGYAQLRPDLQAIADMVPDGVKALTAADCDVTYLDIESSWGHDAFLLEVDTMTRLLSSFVGRVMRSF